MEASLNVFRRYCIKVGGLKRDKELSLSNVVDVSLDEGLKFSTIRPL